VECFDLIHPCLNFLLTNQLRSVDSGGSTLGSTGRWSKAGMRMGKLEITAGVGKGGLSGACFRCKGMTDTVMRFFRFRS